MESKLSKAVDRYISDNCTTVTNPQCITCKSTSKDLYDDDLSGQIFCRDCLTDDLKTDTDFAVDYLGETDASQGRI